MVKHVGKFRLGRKRPTGKPKFKISEFFKALPSTPTWVNYKYPAMTALHDIYLNDQLGDCVIAGGYHVEGVTTAGAGTPFVATTAQITSDYSAIGGYVPGNPNTDQGCDEQTALTYWTQTGFASGNKIGCWMAVDATNVAQMKVALYLFENLYSGIELPDAWVNADMPNGDGFIWDVAGAPDPNNGHCFTGDTTVSLLDGREVSFADLAEGVVGNEFWVYSCDDEGNVVPGKAHSVRKTRINAEIVKVTLDNGESIRCTPDHKFMMRDGSYKEAKDLVGEDSLMPLYRRVNEYGYEKFYNPRTKGFQLTHRVSAFGVGGNGDGLVAHHYDFNKRNNSPDNLKPMTAEAHSKLHQETGCILAEYSRSEKGRQKSRELMTNMWNDPEWCEEQIIRLNETASERGKATAAKGLSGFKTMDSEIRRQNGLKVKGRIQTAEDRAKKSEARKNRIANDPIFREQLRENALKASHAASEKAAQKREECANNHKVVSVEPCGKEDVYDMTVDKYHNFALSAGIFVHNCITHFGYNEKYVVTDTWGMVGYVTWAAMAQYMVPSVGGELYVLVMPDMINKAYKKAPNGMNWAALAKAANELGGNLPTP